MGRSHSDSTVSTGHYDQTLNRGVYQMEQLTAFPSMGSVWQEMCVKVEPRMGKGKEKGVGGRGKAQGRPQVSFTQAY